MAQADAQIAADTFIEKIEMNDELTAKLSKADGHKYYEFLQKNEPQIDWYNFAAEIYNKSKSTSSVMTYYRGIYKFRQFLQEQNKTIAGLIAEIQSQAPLVYKVLNNFAIWCNLRKGYAPKTTTIYVQSAKRLFVFLDIEIDETKFRYKVSMPKKNHALKDEYPANEVIHKILNACATQLRTYLLVMSDAGLEPIDAAQLKPRYIKFAEDPIRLTFEREKTGETIETFISKETAEALKQVIAYYNVKPDDYIFVKEINDQETHRIKVNYTNALARAGLGKVVKKVNENGDTRYYSVVEKIEGHKYGKYHMKVFKKRWFSIAITVAPEYIVQGMLGRKKYLDEYNRQPLQVKQDYGKKILRAVNIYRNEQNKQEVLDKTSEILGVKIDENTLKQLRDAILFSNQYANLPSQARDKINEIMQGGASA